MNRNKFGMALNGTLAAIWGYTALKMIFTEYTPPRFLVLGMVVILVLESLVNVADFRLKFWNERKAQAEKEREDWLDAALGDWKMNDNGTDPLA